MSLQCQEYDKVRKQVLELWQKGIPLCVEVLLMAGCDCKDEDLGCSTANAMDLDESGFLLEQWFISISHRRYGINHLCTFILHSHFG